MFLILLCSFFFSACSSSPKETPPADEKAASILQKDEFEIRRGTNISHWLSQSDRRGAARKAFFTEADVKRIADMGFDHIRIPVDEEQLWDEQGNKEAAAFELLHQALEWSAKHDLKAIVDLHILRSHHFNSKDIKLWTDSTAQEGFLNFWRDLSEELSSYPTSAVAYELMNEPVAKDAEDWNKLVARAVQVIREREPKRFIVIGSNMWQHADTFDELRVPENDPNIILSFHLYDPMMITHYKASWVDIHPYKGPVHYPGQSVKEEDMKDLDPALAKKVQDRNGVWNIEVLEAKIQEPLKKARETGLQLYCGEWGAITSAPTEDRLRWYQDVRKLFEKHNIAYANWDYKSSNFGIINDSGEEINPVVTQALVK